MKYNFLFLITTFVKSFFFYPQNVKQGFWGNQIIEGKEAAKDRERKSAYR